MTETNDTHLDVPSAGELQSVAVRGSFWTGLATVAGIPFGLAGTIVAARVLGPESFGRLSLLLFMFPLAVSLLDFGFGTVTGWLVAANSLGDRRQVHAAVSSYATWSLCKLPLLVLVGVFFVGRRPLELVVYAAITAGYLYLSVVQLSLSAERQFRAGSLLNLLGIAASTVALVAAASVTHDYRISFLARTGGLLLIIPFAALALEAGVRTASLHPGKVRLAREMRPYAVASYISYVASLWVFGRSETIFLNSAGRLVDLGRFSAATTISARATLLSDALYASLDPSIVALQQAHGEIAGRAFVRVTRLGCVVGVSTAVAVMPLAVLVAPILFGSEYGRLSVPIVALTVASIVWTSVGPVNAWVIAHRKTRGMIVPGIVAACIDAALAAVLCPVLGLAGAVVASVAATATILSVLIAVGLEDRRERIEVIRCAAYVVLIAVLAGLISLGMKGLGTLVAVGGSYGGILVTSYILLRFVLPPIADHSDLDAIRNAAPARFQSYVQRLLAPFAGARVRPN